MAWNEKLLKNLSPMNSDKARKMQAKSVTSRLANTAVREQFKLTAKNFMKVRDELPEISALDVLRMAMYTALQEENFEDAARYANMVAEYEAPKLQRIEKSTTLKTEKMTDEELQRIIQEENLND